MNVKIVRLMGFFGVAAPIIGALMIFLSVQYTPGWDPASHTLSQLGAEGFGAILFNSGLLMTGAVMMMFSTGLFEVSKRDRRGQVGSAVYLAASVLTAVLGVATVQHQPIHDFLAIVLFVLIPLSMVAYSVYLWTRSLKVYAALGILGGVIGVAVMELGGPINALKELASAGSLGVWQMALGYWMLRQRESEG
ncbi:MAG TPA: DUF998 domain-containing protein [Candidatus Bathyarchaeia archaeon]